MQPRPDPAVIPPRSVSAGARNRRFGWVAALLIAGGCGEPAPEVPADRGGAETPAGEPVAAPSGPPALAGPPDPAAEAAREAALAASRQEMAAAEQAFINELLQTRIGLGSVADYGLSPGVVRRAARRTLQQRYQDRQHAVFADRPVDPPVEDAAPPPTTAGFTATIEPHFVDDAVMSRREEAPVARPANRGFRGGDVPGIATADDPWPTTVRASGDVYMAAQLVARRLATDGVGATAVRALALMRPALPDGDPAARAAAAVRRLRDIGLPVDLLAFLPAEDGSPREAVDAVSDLLERLEPAGDDAAIDAVARAVSEIRLVVRPSRPGFRAVRDDGVDPIRLVRLQPTRGTYWEGGDQGGSLHLAAAVLAAMPDTDMVLSIGRPFVPPALERLQAVRAGASASTRVVDEAHVVTQWAQDNGQPGLVDGDRRPWLLAPRYASRGDLGSTLDPGDTWMVDGLVAAGIGLVRSPLLFQGGNLLVVGDPTDPAASSRLLVIGDSEIDRNVSLGLRREEVVEAFRVEFGVDRVAVVEPPAFHLDFAATIRRIGDRSVAFVHDEARGFGLLVDAGIERLATAGLLPAGAATRAIEAHRAGDSPTVISIIGPALFGRRRPDGQWPLTLIDAFALEGQATSAAIGDFDRFLTGFERLLAVAAGPESIPGSPVDRLYLATLAARESEVSAFRRELEALGFETVDVPGFALQRRSVNAVNMIHGRGRLLRPVSGGLLTRIDEAAAVVIAAAVGPDVEVLDIPTGETQRRSGAIGCAAAVWATSEPLAGFTAPSPTPSGPAGPAGSLR